MTEATRTTRATTPPSVQPDQTAGRAKTTERGHGIHRVPVGAIARWTLAVLAVLWLSFCTAIGPFYWFGGSIADWTMANTLYFLLALIIYMALLIALVRFGGGRIIIPPSLRSACRRAARAIQTFCRTGWPRHILKPLYALARGWRRFATTRFARAMGRCWRAIRSRTPRIVMRCTSSWIGLALIMFIGWLWVPVTLLSAFGADIRSQIREFSWAWNQWTGLQQPYTGFFAFVPMDIYPTAHYLWPQNPTYLTDQHNLVLTVFYGAVAAASRYFTGSNDAGYVVLSSLQFLFAVFCC